MDTAGHNMVVEAGVVIYYAKNSTRSSERGCHYRVVSLSRKKERKGRSVSPVVYGSMVAVVI